MIIGITGTAGAGKGTVVEILKKHGFKHFYVTDFLIEEIKKRGLPINRDRMIQVADDLRRTHSPSYILEEMYRQALDYGGDSVIERVGAVAELNFLKGKGVKIIGVDADQKTRYNRIIERKGDKDFITYEKFLDHEEYEGRTNDPTRQSLRDCLDLSDYKLSNNSTIEKLEEEVLGILEEIRTGKRSKVNWDGYFMTMVYLVAEKSKDEATHMGAVIVGEGKEIKSTGYNSFVRGLNDKVNERQIRPEKYFWFEHAERNAVYNATLNGVSLKGSVMYTNGIPCMDCARAIVQAGIKEVVVDKKWEEHNNPTWFEQARRTIEMFKETMVNLRYWDGEFLRIRKYIRGREF